MTMGISRFLPHRHGRFGNVWPAAAAILFACGLGGLMLQANSAGAPHLEAGTEAELDASAQGRVQAAATSAVPDSLQGGGAAISRPVAYDPARPLSSQLDQLKAGADRGDAYATCIIAMALDACVNQMNRGDDNPLSLASADVIEKGTPGEVERVSRELSFYDKTEVLCAELGQPAMLERDERLYRSAMMGHPASMARFALNPVSTGSVNLKDLDRLLKYREMAPSMLDRAAKAGVPDALRGIHRAYAAGAIETTVGDIEVPRDPVKSAAAGLALSGVAHGDERIEIEKTLRSTMAGMTADQRREMAVLVREYRQALAVTGAAAAGEGTQDDRYLSPEQRCAFIARR